MAGSILSNALQSDKHLWLVYLVPPVNNTKVD